MKAQLQFMRHDDDMSLKLHPQFLIIHLFCEAIGSFQLKIDFTIG
jgi:hypothetical protein